MEGNTGKSSSSNNASVEDLLDGFDRIECNMTKCLVLVGLMDNQKLIGTKESTRFKQYLIESTDQKRCGIIKSFNRKRSLSVMWCLYVLRTTLRGHLGLPRTRKSKSIAAIAAGSTLAASSCQTVDTVTKSVNED